jgi:NAD(P)-dependent dehydrogenase (short-subunit alcohol dehydrogenase family)
MKSFPPHGLAVVIGATGGIGAALVEALIASKCFSDVIGVSRVSDPAIDLTSDASVAAAAQAVAARDVPIRLVIIATGILHGIGLAPEKSLRDLDAGALAQFFAINAIGPALVMKHFLPLMPRDGKSVFAALSARVGSIGDNRLGGWYGYRASKSALNQLLRTASVEIGRSRPAAICVALHPGTVATPLSAPFAKSGLNVEPPAISAAQILSVIDGLTVADTGDFFDHLGQPIPW